RSILGGCAVAALAAQAAAQEWEVFFDSEGFEEFPLGPAPWPDPYPELLPHIIAPLADPGPAPTIVQAPDPTLGEQSIRLEAHERVTPIHGRGLAGIRYAHRDARFGKKSFRFPASLGQGGYRGLRASFDLYHAFDGRPGSVE